MGMQYEDSSGRKLTEFFPTKEEMEKRAKELTAEGGKVLRKVELHVNPKYPEPHQGAQEIERRRKRLEAALAKHAEKSA